MCDNACAGHSYSRMFLAVGHGNIRVSAEAARSRLFLKRLSDFIIDGTDPGDLNKMQVIFNANADAPRVSTRSAPTRHCKCLLSDV